MFPLKTEVTMFLSGLDINGESLGKSDYGLAIVQRFFQCYTSRTRLKENLEKSKFKFNFELVEQQGGEGEGEYYCSVYSFVSEDGTDTCYVMFEGSYMSYDGATYEEWFFVEPKTVEVIQYFRV